DVRVSTPFNDVVAVDVAEDVRVSIPFENVGDEIAGVVAEPNVDNVADEVAESVVAEPNVDNVADEVAEGVI
ncbi:hypothetical protein A2U01_0007421, partial [Trifolium medium]|nr:hypothetical protein [Trifolium medium]